MMVPTLLKQYNFYCAECETKTKAMLYFKTWCPCKESSVLATVDTIEYHGMAVSEEEWELQDEKIPPVIGPIDIDFVRRHR